MAIEKKQRKENSVQRQKKVSNVEEKRKETEGNDSNCIYMK